MTKRTLIIVLLASALLTLGYAIYRSTDQRITYMEEFKHTTIGEPQHGLILGLCIFAGLCIIGIVPLLLDRQDDRKEESTVVTRRPL